MGANNSVQLETSKQISKMKDSSACKLDATVANLIKNMTVDLGTGCRMTVVEDGKAKSVCDLSSAIKELSSQQSKLSAKQKASLSLALNNTIQSTMTDEELSTKLSQKCNTVSSAMNTLDNLNIKTGSCVDEHGKPILGAQDAVNIVQKGAVQSKCLAHVAMHLTEKSANTTTAKQTQESLGADLGDAEAGMFLIPGLIICSIIVVVLMMKAMKKKPQEQP